MREERKAAVYRALTDQLMRWVALALIWWSLFGFGATPAPARGDDRPGTTNLGPLRVHGTLALMGPDGRVNAVILAPRPGEVELVNPQTGASWTWPLVQGARCYYRPPGQSAVPRAVEVGPDVPGKDVPVGIGGWLTNTEVEKGGP